VLILFNWANFLIEAIPFFFLYSNCSGFYAFSLLIEVPWNTFCYHLIDVFILLPLNFIPAWTLCTFYWVTISLVCPAVRYPLSAWAGTSFKIFIVTNETLFANPLHLIPVCAVIFDIGGAQVTVWVSLVHEEGIRAWLALTFFNMVAVQWKHAVRNPPFDWIYYFCLPYFTLKAHAHVMTSTTNSRI